MSLASPPPSYQGMLLTEDGLSLFAQGWRPKGDVRGLVAIVHGLAEHSGRHARLAAYLVRHGFAVHTYDQRGHGRSDGRRAYVRSFDQLLDDLGLFLASVRARFPDVPCFLLGHSMGGAEAVLYTLERDAAVSGLILSSPALRLGDSVPALLQKIGAVIGWLLPWLPTLPIDRSLLSHDPEIVADAERDPLNVHARLPARTGGELLRATRRIEQQMERLALPLLLIHGTGDRLTDPQGSIDLYRRASSDDKTLGLYPNLYHETFNEPDGEQVIDEIGVWLEEHTD